MSNGSSTDFIGRNRPPRVHIEYKLEKWGSRKKVELPFVMGIMANLSGKPNPDVELPPLEARKFHNINIDTFNNFLKSIKPRIAFSVPNTITGEGDLPVDITFESIKDFSPGAVASKVVSELLKERESLRKLKNSMDGKMNAENFTVAILKNRKQLEALLARESQTEAETEAEKGTEKGRG
jgi:type VI secretion system protein ImpB